MFSSPYLLLVALPSLLIALWAQAKVRGAMARYSRMPAQCGLSGAEAASAILAAQGVHNVTIEPTTGWLGDHYDPATHVLRLSPGVFEGRSVAALGIAAHEAGHALQQAHNYAPLAVRTAIVPMAALGNLAWPILLVGLVLRMSPLGALMVMAAIVLFLTAVILQLVNLPVEYNASHRAHAALVKMGLVRTDEAQGIKVVLSAAALTYVAAALGAILQLIYFIGLARRGR